MQSRRKGPVSAGRRVLRYESDSDEEDCGRTQVAPEPPALTEAQKEVNANLSQLADLGTGRRHHVTAVDKGRQDRVNLGAHLRDRDCNQPGTQAADLAAEYRPQLVGWANFGNTTTNDGTYEELPDIARGQSHRQGVAETLLNEGITSLEDTYGDPRRRHGIPSPMTNHRGGNFAATRGGRGGGNVGSRGKSTVMSSNPSNRPLDPAIVDGEKDSKYANGGLQSRARPKSNVHFDDNVVRVTSMAAKGGGIASTGRGGSKAVQDRPRPPAALQHLTSQLDDNAGFMAAYVARMSLQAKKTVVIKPLPEKEEPKKDEPKPNTNQHSVPQLATPSRSEPIVALNGIPIRKTDAPQAAVKQVSREEFRTIAISPSSLTDGNTSSEILQSPSVDEREETPLIGLGVSGVKTELSVPVPTTIEVEIEIVRQFILDRDTEALIRYLTPLLNTAPAAAVVIPPTTQTPQDLRASLEVSSVKVESLTDLRRPCQNPFSPREPVAKADGFVQLLPSKPRSKPSSKSVDFVPETLPSKPVYKPVPAIAENPPSTLPQKPQPDSVPAQPFSALKSKGLSESKWATSSSSHQPAAKVSILQPKTTNDSLSGASKNNGSIIGDIKNVSRLTEEEGRRLKATQASFPSKAKVMTFMQPGDGFKALLKEVEGLNLKSQSQPKSASAMSPEFNNVTAALNTASALGAQFGTYRGKTDGNESDESEL